MFASNSSVILFLLRNSSILPILPCIIYSLENSPSLPWMPKMSQILSCFRTFVQAVLPTGLLPNYRTASHSLNVNLIIPFSGMSSRTFQNALSFPCNSLLELLHILHSTCPNCACMFVMIIFVFLFVLMSSPPSEFRITFVLFTTSFPVLSTVPGL